MDGLKKGGLVQDITVSLILNITFRSGGTAIMSVD